MQPIELLGTRISPDTKNTLLKRIECAFTIRVKAREDPRQGAYPLWIVTANPEILLKAYRDNAYRSILNQADVIVADGIGVVLAARLLYGVRLERITGADLAEDILRLAALHHKKVFLLGGSNEVNQKAIKKITNYKLQITNVAGLGGRFTDNKATKEIINYQPDIVFVALGAPRQEQFIYRLLKIEERGGKPPRFSSALLRSRAFGAKAIHRGGKPPRFPLCAKNKKLKTALVMGIGGTIDFWAFPKLRAPKLLQYVGLEWLWRLCRQPWRLTRITNAVIVFPALLIKNRLSKT